MTKQTACQCPYYYGLISKQAFLLVNAIWSCIGAHRALLSVLAKFFATIFWVGKPWYYKLAEARSC
jgi:hypothetical protein